MQQRFNSATGKMEDWTDEGKQEPSSEAINSLAPVVPATPAPPAPLAPPPGFTVTEMDRTTKVPTAEENRLLTEQPALDAAALKSQGDQNKLNAQKAEGALTESTAGITRQEERQKSINDALSKAEIDIQARTKEYDDRYNDYKAQKFEDVWSRKGTGAQIMAAIAMGLGQYATAMGGGPNTAADIVNKAIDRDFAEQKAKIEKGETTAKMAKEGIAIGRANKDDLLKDLDVKEAAAKDLVAAKWEQKLRQWGKSEQEIVADAELNKLKQSALNTKLKLQEGLRTDVKEKMVSAETKKADAEIKTAATDVEKNKNVAALRKEFNDLPEVKDYKTVASSYEKIKSAEPGGAGDLSLVYGYIKSLDPGSTVRESEADLATNIGGLPEKSRSFVQTLTGQGSLTPEQRRQIKESSRSLMAAQELRIRDSRKQYEKEALNIGLKPEEVSRVVTVQPVEVDKETIKAPKEVTRTVDGKEAVFDESTKTFIRWK